MKQKQQNRARYRQVNVRFSEQELDKHSKRRRSG